MWKKITKKIAKLNKIDVQLKDKQIWKKKEFL